MPRKLKEVPNCTKDDVFANEASIIMMTDYKGVKYLPLERRKYMICNKGYVTKQGYSCFNICVANYLEFKNIMLDEIDLFLKGKGYEIEILEDGRIIYSLLKNSLHMLDIIGIPYEYKKIQDGENAKEILSEIIKNEELVTVFLKTSCLKYNSIFMYENDVEHCVNVIGMDEHDRVLISDGYIPGYKASCFEGWVSFDELLNAWENANSDYVIFYLDKMADQTTENKRDGMSDIFSLYIADNEKVANCFIDEANCLKDYDNDIRSSKLMELNRYIRVGGFITVKNYFLEILNKYVSDKDIAEKYSNICKEWNVISCMLIKLIYVNVNSKYEEIICKMRKLFDSENEILSGIIKNNLLHL